MAAWLNTWDMTSTTATAATGWIRDNNGNYWLFPSWHNSLVTNNTASTMTTNNTIIWPVWHNNIEAPAIVHDEQWHEERRIVTEREERSRQQLKDASVKAKELLLEHLTPSQRRTLEEKGWFLITGGKSGKIYRLSSRSIAGNVEEMSKEGKALARYCCHLDHRYPTHDHHLAQKIMLEHNEEEFLRLANRSAA